MTGIQLTLGEDTLEELQFQTQRIITNEVNKLLDAGEGYLFKETLTISETASYLNTSEATVNKMRKDGLKYSQYGRRIWIHKKDLIEFLEEFSVRENSYYI